MPTPYVMRQRFAWAPPAAAVLALCSPVLAPAADLLGFYAGAAVGQADVRANRIAFGTPLGFNEHATGWKVLVGIRPISLIGAELEYADFGHPSVQPPLGPPLGTEADAHPRATTLSGLLYAPVPLPFLDLYGKVGLSRLRTDVHADVVCTTIDVSCPPTIPFAPFALNETTTNFAYGAGARLKFSAFAVQLEYERISTSGGDPDLLSVGFTCWIF
jgi:Outer membrane protein beta-barrel domain